MKQKGFTLIELLVVISIIGLLSSVLFVSLNNARVKARDAKRKSEIKQIVTGLVMYYNAHNSYPANTYNGACGTALNGTDLISQGLINDGIIKKIPLPPSNSGQCGDYYYSGTWNNAQSLAIMTKLENADVGCKPFTGDPDWYISGSYCNGIYIVTQ